MGERQAGEWQRVASAIETEIVFGQRLTREHLVEDELMLRLGASRHAVRRAFDELRRLGLVVSEPNRGTRVRDYTVKEVEDLYQVREMLEVEAALNTCVPCPDGLVPRLVAIQQQHEAASREGRLLELFACNNTFHETLYASCGNPTLADAIRTYATQTHPIRSHAFPDEARRVQAVQDHWAMIACVENGDRRKLASLCRKHLRRPKRDYIRLHAPVALGLNEAATVQPRALRSP